MRNNVKDKKENNFSRFAAMYLFTYAPIGVLCPLIGQYLDSIGFTGTQIGTVTSVSTIVSIIASAFWGKRYSNSTDGKRIVSLLCLMAAVFALINFRLTTFGAFLICFSVMYFFQGPVIGLSDTMTLEVCSGFASMRLFGSIGYAVAVFVGGKVCQRFGLDKIFIIYAVAFVIASVIIMTTKKNKSAVVKMTRETSSLKKIAFKDLLGERKALELIICGIFIFGTNVANNTYFGFLYNDGGGNLAGLGTIFFLMVASEAPFMALAPVLAKKITSGKLIAIAMIISAVRFGVYALGPSAGILMALFFTQGLANGILLVEYVKYLSSVVDAKLIAIAISLFYAVSSNGGTILCNFFGGVAMDYMGSKGVYALFSALNIVGIALYFLFGLHNNKK